jgi:hypothetical protein
MPATILMNIPTVPAKLDVKLDGVLEFCAEVVGLATAGVVAVLTASWVDSLGSGVEEAPWRTGLVGDVVEMIWTTEEIFLLVEELEAGVCEDVDWGVTDVDGGTTDVDGGATDVTDWIVKGWEIT